MVKSAVIIKQLGFMEHSLHTGPSTTNLACVILLLSHRIPVAVISYSHTKPSGCQVTDAVDGVNRILALITLESRVQIIYPDSSHFTSIHGVGSKDNVDVLRGPQNGDVGNRRVLRGHKRRPQR